MASTARLGLKRIASQTKQRSWPSRNGLYSPFGIETSLNPHDRNNDTVGMASTARLGLKRATCYCPTSPR